MFFEAHGLFCVANKKLCKNIQIELLNGIVPIAEEKLIPFPIPPRVFSSSIEGGRKRKSFWDLKIQKIDSRRGN